MKGFLNTLTCRLIEKNYLKHKLWHSTEIKKSHHVENPSAGGKQVFDSFEKVISNYMFCFNMYGYLIGEL